MTTTRAERRREKHAEAKAEKYKRTGFVDRATYQCAVPGPECDREGNPLARPFTPAELHQRAVERRDNKRHAEKIAREQIDASKEADKARRREAKAKTRAIYLNGFNQPAPTKHMHSAARRRAAVRPLAA